MKNVKYSMAKFTSNAIRRLISPDSTIQFHYKQSVGRFCSPMGLQASSCYLGGGVVEALSCLACLSHCVHPGVVDTGASDPAVMV